MSKQTEYRKVTKEYYEDVAISVICDGCGKAKKTIPKSWHEFSAHHTEWGNDSVDSIEYYHVCSAGCYPIAIKKAFEEYKEYKSAQIDNFNYRFAEKIAKIADEDNNE